MTLLYHQQGPSHHHRPSLLPLSLFFLLLLLLFLLLLLLFCDLRVTFEKYTYISLSIYLYVPKISFFLSSRSVSSFMCCVFISIFNISSFFVLFPFVFLSFLSVCFAFLYGIQPLQSAKNDEETDSFHILPHRTFLFGFSSTSSFS